MASSNSTSSFTAVNDTDFSQLDLNGKIIIKAQYVDDIRRIPIIGDEITYDELILMMQRLFKLQPTDEIHLKYRDDDNDLISIIDDNDLSFAIQYSRILKLKVFVNEKITPGTGRSTSMNDYKQICHELIDIRNRCNQLLEKMHLSGDKKSSKNNNLDDSASSDTNEVHTQTDRQHEKQQQQQEQPKIYGQPPRELDPLHNSDVRGATPKSEPTSQQQQ
ncbi:PAT1-like protein, partial [Euroglyphus maynei]